MSERCPKCSAESACPVKRGIKLWNCGTFLDGIGLAQSASCLVTQIDHLAARVKELESELQESNDYKIKLAAVANYMTNRVKELETIIDRGGGIKTAKLSSIAKEIEMAKYDL